MTRHRGTSRAYALARLERDAPALHAEVTEGRMSPHAAMVRAGFRAETFSVRSGSAAMVADTLRRRLTPEVLAELHQLLPVSARRPVVKVDPAVRFGTPHIKGVSTETLADLHWVGEDAATICDEYGLTLHELLVAWWFEGTHGQPRFRRRWKAWAAEVAYPRLAGWVKPLDVDMIPLPPDGTTTSGRSIL